MANLIIIIMLSRIYIYGILKVHYIEIAKILKNSIIADGEH